MAPGFLKVVVGAVRDVLRQQRQADTLSQARAQLERGDLGPIQRLAHQSVGEAWLALADFYASQSPEDSEHTTAAYLNALQCKGWSRPSRVDEECDRRRFLGIGTPQNFHALIREWNNLYHPGHERETQLAWIYACGPAELRDLTKAWWWVAIAEARWGRLKDATLPTLTAQKLRDHLAETVRSNDRLRLHEEAKEQAHAEFVAGK